MQGFGNYLLDILGEFGAGRGEATNEYVRFLLASVFWAALVITAYSKRTRDPQQRESLLLIGFSFGLARELFVFVTKSLFINGVIEQQTLELFFPPLDHTFLVIARTMIGAAMIRFLVQNDRLEKWFLRVSLAAIGSFYVILAPVWWLRVLDDSELRFSMFIGDWIVHSIGLAISLSVLICLARPLGNRRWSVLAAFTLFALDDFLMLVNLATDESYKWIFSPIRHNVHIWAIPFFAWVYFSELREERDRLTHQLRQSERLEAVGQLSAGVAHDFNNLLQVISGYTEVATEKVANDHDAQRALGHISDASQRATILVRQLLAFSRQDTPVRQRVDLNDTIAHLTPMLGRLLGSGIQLEHELDPDLPKVWADHGMMEQVVVNLSVNARDAMPGGGTLTLRTSRQPHLDRSEVPFASLTVSDTGTGMANETAEHAFDPFYTTKDVGQGSGLGLATVHGIVASHAGRIQIDSVIGEGTDVIVHLPVARTKPSAEDGSEPIADRQHNVAAERGVILVAEDEYAVRSLTVELLRKAGYIVKVSNDGEEAVAAFRRAAGTIDLLVFDVAMPNLSGYVAYDQIRQTDPNIPVLFVTGSAGLGGAKPDEPHLNKPFGRAELLEAVRTLIRSGRQNVVNSPR